MPTQGSGAASGAVAPGFTPPPYSGYPTAGDLGAYLTSLRIIPEAESAARLAGMDLVGMAAAAAAEWENAVDWNPFLATGIPAERRYNPPDGSRTLDLGAGALTVASLWTGVTIDSAGEERIYGRDWFFREAPYGYPYTGIRLPSGPCRTWSQSVVVTADWGFAATIPPDVWQACLQYGAYLCVPQLSLPLSGGVESLRVLSSEVKYGAGGALSAQAKGWMTTFAGTAARYLRSVI